MVFYRIEARRDMPENENALDRREKRAVIDRVAERTESFYESTSGRTYIATVGIFDDTATFFVISRTNNDLKALFEDYIKDPVFQITSYKMDEITFATMSSLMSQAYRNNYITDDDDIYDRFELDELNHNHGALDFGEAMIENMSKADCIKTAKGLLFEDTVVPEIERIYEGTPNKRTVGHPVHYMLEADDREVRKTVYKTLLSSLYSVGRIKNRRYAYVDYCSESRIPGTALEALYRSSEGGTVVIRYVDRDEKESHFARRSFEMIGAIASVIQKYKNTVLTVICLFKGANRIKDAFLTELGCTAFVEMREDIAYSLAAEGYLKEKARLNKVRTDKRLLSLIEDGRGYTAIELDRMFDEWHSKKLKNEIYPQYKSVQSAQKRVQKEKPCGTGYERLQALIGLNGAKAVMNSALNYFKVQKLFKDRGMIDERPSMHMVFTGNPGTAKTTVARLFAEIMKENGLLSNGDLYEVGRADIVGKYVGSTAPLVKEAFRRAKGGVLFIDEAYSLVDDRDGLFGDEAINTIVQEMENNRKDTVVIFAGYPDKMEGFLNKNPGLRSRIAFNVHFDDYGTDELVDIAVLIAGERSFVLSLDAKEKLKTVFNNAKERSDFGNGRYVRTVIEKAKMVQASRLVKMDIDSITDDDLKTITAQDIELPTCEKVKKKVLIGFTA